MEQFSATYAGEKELKGCPQILAVLSGRTSQTTLEETAQADVGSLRVNGDRGFLLYHGARGLDYAFPVALEAGEWKLAGLEGTPLP